MSEREETRDSNLEIVNEMIQKSKDAIARIERGMQFCDIPDQISACKSITRLTEDVRRLVRLRMKLEKEQKSNKAQGNVENEEHQAGTAQEKSSRFVTRNA